MLAGAQRGFEPLDKNKNLVIKSTDPYTYESETDSEGASYKIVREYDWSYVKEQKVITGKLGVKTWSWKLSGGDKDPPRFQSDGSVSFGSGLTILPPNVTDTKGKPIDSVSWELNGDKLSLTLDDSNYPDTYIIDPTMIYKPVLFLSWACWNVNSSAFACPTKPEYENMREDASMSTGSSKNDNTTIANESTTSWTGPWGIRSGENLTRSRNLPPHDLDNPLYPAGNSGLNAKDGWIYSGMGTGTLPSSEWRIDLTHYLKINSGAGAGFRGIYEGRLWKIRRDSSGNLIGNPVPLTDKFTTGPGLTSTGAVFLSTALTTSSVTLTPTATTAGRTFAPGDALLLMVNFNIRNPSDTANVALAPGNEVRFRLHQRRPSSGHGATAINFGGYTAPDLFLPGTVTAEATSSLGSMVEYSATAQDELDGQITPVCSHLSGSQFPLGVTTVTCIAENSKGLPMTGSFTVNVVDTTPPNLDLPDDMIIEVESSLGAPVNYSVGADDLVSDNLEPECSPQSGANFLPGAHLVQCSVEDDAGNRAEGSFLVTVIDTSIMVATLHIDDADLKVRGSIGSSVDILNSTHGVASVTFSLDGQGGAVDLSPPYEVALDTTLVPDGMATVTALIIDNLGNSLVLTEEILVDNTDPFGSLEAILPAVQGGGAVGGQLTIGGEVNDATSGVLEYAVTYMGSQPGAVNCTGVATYSCLIDTTALEDGSYTYTLTVTDVVGNIRVENLELVIDNTDPEIDFAGYEETSNPDAIHAVGNVLYYNPSSAGGVRVSHTINDITSGIASVQYPDLIGFALGGAGAGAYDYVYNWSAGAQEPGPASVTVSDYAGNTLSGGEYIILSDSAVPTDGSLNYTSGYVDGEVEITYSPGVDIESGVRSWQLQRSSADLINGVCSNYTPYTTISAGASPYSDADLDNGQCYKYQLLVTDNVGNEAVFSSSNVVMTDSTPPGGTIDPDPVGPANGELTITGTVGDEGSGVDSSSLMYSGPSGGMVCNDLSLSWSCEWDTALLPDGIYTLTLNVTDNAGNSSPEAAQRTIEIDNTNPSIEISALTPLTNPQYQYVQGSELYYNPLYTGSFRVNVSASDPNLSQVIFPALASGWSPGGGTDSLPPFELEYAWTEGTEGGSYQVQATDLAGNNALASFQTIADSSSPVDGTVSYQDGYTSDPVQTITVGTPSDILSGVASTSLQRRSGQLVGGVCSDWDSWVTVDNDPGASVEDSLASEGCYQYRLLASDRVGNSEFFSSSSVIKLDMTAPEASNVIVSDSADYIISASSNACYGPLATGTSFTVSIDATDANSGVENVQLPVIAGMGSGALNGQTLTSPVVGNTYQSSGGVYTFGNSLLSATGPQTTTITDLAGNTATATFVLSLDNIVPSLPTISDTSAGWQNTSSVTVAASGATDDGCSGGIAAYEYELSGAQSGSGYDSSVDITQEGVTLVKFRAIDYVGNVGNWAERTVRIDRSDPTLSDVVIIEDSPKLYVSGESNMFYNSNDSDGEGFTVTVQASSPISPLVHVMFPNISGMGAGASAGPDTVTAPSSGNTYETNNYALGASPYSASGSQTITALNEAGNTSTASFTLIPDGDAPTSPVLTSTPESSMWTNVASVTIQAADSEDSGGSGVKGYAYTTSGATMISGSGDTVEITEEGVTTVSFTAIDNVGNISEVSTYTVRIDRGEPVISNFEFVENSDYLHSLGGTMYYNSSPSSPANSVHFAIRIDATDAVSGVSDVTFRSIDGLGTGAISGPAVQASPVSGSTYQSDAGAHPDVYTLGLSPYSAASAEVVAEDGSGLEDSASGSLIADAVAPTIPTITAPNNLDSWHCPVGSENIIATGSVDAGSGVRYYQYNLGSGWITGGSITFTSLDEGIHNVVFRAVDNVGNVSENTATQLVRIDCSDPSALLLSIDQTINLDAQHVIGDTAYYNPATSGTLTVNIAAVDNESGLQGVQYNGTFSGWTTPSLVTGFSPYAGVYTWTPGAVSPGSLMAYALDNAGRSAGVGYSIVADSQAPDNFSVAPTNGASVSGGNVFLNTTSAQLSINSGNDTLSGVRGWSLYRAQATYSGGVCGVFNYAGAVLRTSGTTPTSSFTDTGLSTSLCYQYGLEVVDNVGNTVRTYGIQNVVLDVASPVMVTPVITESSTAMVVNTGPSLCYRPSQVGGTPFTVSSVVTDNIAVQSVTYPQVSGRMGTGAIIGPQPLLSANGGANTYQYTYQFGTSVPSVGLSSYTVSALDVNSNSSSTSFSMQSDGSAPSVPNSFNSNGYQFGQWSNALVVISPSGSVDSGCAGLDRYQWSINGGSTWNELIGGSVTLGPGGMVDASAGEWSLVFRAVDKVGIASSASSALSVRVDTVAPVVASPYLNNPTANTAFADSDSADNADFGPRSSSTDLEWRSSNTDTHSGPNTVELFYCARTTVVYGDTCLTGSVSTYTYNTISAQQKGIEYNTSYTTPNGVNWTLCIRGNDNAGNESFACGQASAALNHAVLNTYMAHSYTTSEISSYHTKTAPATTGDWKAFHGNNFLRVSGGYTTCADVKKDKPNLSFGALIPAISCSDTRAGTTECPSGGIVGTGSISTWTQRSWLRVPYGAGNWIDVQQGAYYLNASNCSINLTAVNTIVAGGASSHGQWTNFDGYPNAMNTGQQKTWVFYKVGSSGVTSIDIDDTWTGRP
jgi:hypothetical protein